VYDGAVSPCRENALTQQGGYTPSGHDIFPTALNTGPSFCLKSDADKKKPLRRVAGAAGIFFPDLSGM